MYRRFLWLPLLFVAPLPALPQKGDAPAGKDEPKAKAAVAPRFDPASYAGLRLRSIGPGLVSGRVVGLSVHPDDPAHYYAAAASGGVWKTTNGGTSWRPVFDGEGSYSIGYVLIDPKAPQTVWVGTGENNSQRSVSYGDGVYKSIDGGVSWKKVGLEKSEHIGKILIDPRDSNTVYVAAQGPLWGPGGDRGLYKTTDGGKTWKQALKISENTGVNDVVLDPRNPDVLLASAHQRRRHVYTLINGGPESAIYRSTDAGKTWAKITAGLPAGDKGRINLAVAPSRPDVVYASVEAADGQGGTFRSTDFGVSWEKRNSFDRGAMYFGKLFVDPKNADRVYVTNVYLQVSDDGGKTLRNLGTRWVHVDFHWVWVNPKNASHYRVGCDGGIYESYDAGANWRHFSNLPITQFYDITVDENAPFYNVYGGTQDNNTIGGPARTRSFNGIVNEDWSILHVGDGFQCKVDPKDPNTVYAEAQYGDLVRHDRRTGETLGIRPYLPKGEAPLRWNWDSPLVLSPHSRTRLYYAANRVFRSDDRGDSWKVISPDLTRQIDRDKLRVMGRLWGPDAVAKHQSTSLFGNIVAMADSPKQEGLLYVGTDDGLVQVTDDDGKTWRKIERFPGVPEQTYVSRLVASQHSADRVYAAFENHKNSDFRPYLLRSDDRGKTWTSIAGDLPGNGPVLAFAEDHKQPNLLFVGTELGLYFTPDGGKHWVRLKNGLPTIAVRDLAIQKQMDDLVVGTFGRGIYVLDDYSPLRELTAEALKRDASLLSVKDALLYVPTRQFGLRGKGFRGEEYYNADNPPFGAVFTYHLREGLKTRKQRRQEAEQKLGTKDVTKYPTRDELRAEAEEEAPAAVLEVLDGKGEVVQRLEGPAGKGTHRVAWDLRLPSPVLPRPGAREDLFSAPSRGPFAAPGTYRARLLLRQDGKLRPVEGGEQPFQVTAYGRTPQDVAGLKELLEVQQRVVTTQRALSAAVATAGATQARLAEMLRAVDATPKLGAKDRAAVVAAQKKLQGILIALQGDSVLRARNENTPLSIADRLGAVYEDQYYSLARPTATHRALVQETVEELANEVKKLRALVDQDVKAIEKRLDEAGAPYTPGRLPAVGGK